MSSTKRRRARASDGTAAAGRPPPSVPLDLLLEILERSDATTIVRCAATSKPIRSALLDPAFRRRLVPRAAANDDDVDSILLGVSYVFRDANYSRRIRVGQLPRKSSRFDAGLLETFEPVAWRGSVVILRRRWQENFDFEMRACNALTGHTSRLPSPGHLRAKFPHALLAVDGDAGRSFRLLVADLSLRTQIFSSETGEWGAVVEARLPPRFPRYDLKHDSYPLVLGDTVVHWLSWLYGDWHVVALDVSTATATVIELPQDNHCDCDDPAVQLAASADGRLSLLLADAEVIYMWTHSAAAAGSEARWTMKLVIDIQFISRNNGRDCWVRFLGFGERTGTVMLQTDEGGQGLVKINLRSKEALVLSRRRGFRQIDDPDLRLCLHETDMGSLLQAMKRF